jgi:hypothetical protein
MLLYFSAVRASRPVKRDGHLQLHWMPLKKKIFLFYNKYVKSSKKLLKVKKSLKIFFFLHKDTTFLFICQVFFEENFIYFLFLITNILCLWLEIVHHDFEHFFC